MKRIWNWIKGVFGNEREYWTVLLQAKYTDPGVVVESYVSSHIFATWQEAARFAYRLDEQNKSLNVLGVVKICTRLPLTTTVIDYEVTNEDGRHQISYRWPEGVDQSRQQEAENAKANAIQNS